MTLAWLRIWVSPTKEGKKQERKNPKKNKTYENGLAQKEALQVGHPNVC